MDLLIALLIFITIWGALTALLAWCIGKLLRRWSKRRRVIVAAIVAVIAIGALANSSLMYRAAVEESAGIAPDVYNEMPDSAPADPLPPIDAAPPADTPPADAPPAEMPPPDVPIAGVPLPEADEKPPQAAAPQPRPTPRPAPSRNSDVVASRPGPRPLPTFPWPPPAASASIVIPNAVVLRPWEDSPIEGQLKAFYDPQQSGGTGTRLGHVNASLRWSLAHGGYQQASYYSVPGGFALIARMERINEDGTSYQDTERWNADYVSMREFSLSNYLRALFRAPPGYYRVIAFIVSVESFATSNERISADQANLWLEGGGNVLPRDLANQPFRPDHACTALIYEFEKRDVSTDPSGLRPGRLAADTHIIKSKIGEALKWPFQ